MLTISPKQADILQGFFAHVAAVNFDNVKSDYAFYASRLDSAGIPWHVQNAIAESAESRQNVFGLYFKTVLKNNGIIIKESGKC